MLLPNSCIMFPSVFALMHFTCHPCHDVPSPSSIPPPITPPHCYPSHVAIAIATAHAAHLLAAASLRPLASRQGGAVAVTQPSNQAREHCQKWGSYRGRKEGREGGGGTADMLATALWCYATSCTHTPTHTYCRVTNTQIAFFLSSHTRMFRSRAY